MGQSVSSCIHPCCSVYPNDVDYETQPDSCFNLQKHPQDLYFPFELRKEISSTLRLSNKSDDYVAFKIRTTNPKKYCVTPNHTGVLLPWSTCYITVTMQAQKEAPCDMQCKDRFLIQNIVVRPGATTKDITSEMFKKESGYEIEECKLRVFYVAPPPFQAVISKLTKERNSVIQQNKRFQQQLKLLRREANKRLQHELEVISKLTKERNSVTQQNKRFQQELKLMRREANKDCPIP